VRQEELLSLLQNLALVLVQDQQELRQHEDGECGREQ